MELHQSDRVNHEKNLLMSSKWYSFSLATAKLAYARDEDPQDSIILRNLYPNIKNSRRIFGLKEIGHIQTLFLCMLMHFEEMSATLQKRVKYVAKKDFDEVLAAANEMSKQINQLGKLLHEKREDADGIFVRFSNGVGYINIKIFANADFPAIVFFK